MPQSTLKNLYHTFYCNFHNFLTRQTFFYSETSLSGEVTLHLSGSVNWHNVIICGATICIQWSEVQETVTTSVCFVLYTNKKFSWGGGPPTLTRRNGVYCNITRHVGEILHAGLIILVTFYSKELERLLHISVGWKDSTDTDRGVSHPITWPPWSPDLRPQDLICGLHTWCSLLCVPQTLPELAGTIRAAVATVAPAMLNNVWPEYYMHWAARWALSRHLQYAERRSRTFVHAT
jgi:hypothetical protein